MITRANVADEANSDMFEAIPIDLDNRFIIYKYNKVDSQQVDTELGIKLASQEDFIIVWKNNENIHTVMTPQEFNKQWMEVPTEDEQMGRTGDTPEDDSQVETRAEEVN